MEEVKDINELNNKLIADLITNNGEPSECLWEKAVSFDLTLPFLLIQKEGEESILESKIVSFFKCKFYNSLRLEDIAGNIYFEDCIFYGKVDAFNSVFKGKTRFRNCTFKAETIFNNSKFNGLADFWKSDFFEPITFFKTDFNDTVVFSSATFRQNVLFTYSLFAGKSIFGRTVFKKGIDFSQSIITGDLQLFDLQFSLGEYIAKYVGNDDEKYRKFIEKENKIPLINKVTTFQVLKNQFSKQGNHIDEIAMRQQEKKAFSELTQERKKDKNWYKSTVGDRLILWLNRWSNHYRADFRNGISFTVIVAVLFLFLTFLTTQEFWRRLCFDCEFDPNVIGFTIKSFINFLNPAHRITYLEELNPLFGTAYVFDFFGRIAVGYGIYQTVQAFRKFR